MFLFVNLEAYFSEILRIFTNYHKNISNYLAFAFGARVLVFHVVERRAKTRVRESVVLEDFEKYMSSDFLRDPTA